jgi:transposase InsO family protein
MHKEHLTILSHRGKPTDNATIEFFNGRFRDECLNVHWFSSIENAQLKIDAFRWEYTMNIIPNELSRAAALGSLLDER